jgi:hypothetical protein
MSTQVRSRSLDFPIGKKKSDRKVQADSTSLVQSKKKKFLFAFTVFTWIAAAFLFIGFYFAVHTSMAEADWLTGILLGTIVLG